MKALNYGSLNIDFVYNVEHFVRSGETISSQNMAIFAGGKGLNQSVALAKSGIDTWHAGNIGEDGEFLAEILQKREHIQISSPVCRAEMAMLSYKNSQTVRTAYCCTVVQTGRTQGHRWMRYCPILKKAII